MRGGRVIRMRDGEGEARAGLVEDGAVQILPHDDVLGLLRGEASRDPVDSVALRDPETLALPDPYALLAPILAPETWAAGVTYERSREARMAESAVQDVYDLVYDAERPEVFLKDAAGRRTVGPGESVGIRSDAHWNVPEPELALVLGARGELLGATIANDVSSRDIEGANPLYLPQAKIYAAACALGPAILVPEDWEEPFAIELTVRDPDGRVVFSGATSTKSMRRSFTELASFVCRDNPIAAGTVLMTGTGIVPPDDTTLAPGQTVEIRVPRIGTLVNPVQRADELMPVR